MTSRLETIRANRARHVGKLQTLWAESLRRWLTSPRFIYRRPKLARSKYSPGPEDKKHAEQAGA